MPTAAIAAMMPPTIAPVCDDEALLSFELPDEPELLLLEPLPETPSRRTESDLTVVSVNMLV